MRDISGNGDRVIVGGGRHKKVAGRQRTTVRGNRMRTLPTDLPTGPRRCGGPEHSMGVTSKVFRLALDLRFLSGDSPRTDSIATTLRAIGSRLLRNG